MCAFSVCSVKSVVCGKYAQVALRPFLVYANQLKAILDKCRYMRTYTVRNQLSTVDSKDYRRTDVFLLLFFFFRKVQCCKRQFMNQLWQCIFWVAVYINDQCVSLTITVRVCIFYSTFHSSS